MADSVFLGSVWASLDLKVEGFNQGITQAQTSMGNLKNTVLGVFGGTLLANTFQTATRHVVGFASDSLHAAADLETGLNLLQEITQGTASQMELLRQKAVDLGNDLTLPNVSATDAADAMIELGKAGLSVNDIMGASKGVLQAATAGNISVGDAAQYVSNALLAFQLAGTDAVHVADLLAAAANATSADIPDIGLALQQVSAQAHQLGIPLSETVALIGELANVGIRGSDAGTSLKTALQRLIPFSQEAADMYKQLGIDVFDANGQFIGMRATIAALVKGTANLTQEQKQNALQTIFGQDAYRAAATIISGGVEGFDKMTTAVGRMGAAQDLAAARTKGFNGTIGALKSQIETFQISVGNVIKAALEPMLKLISGNLPAAIAVVAGAFVGLATAAFLALGGVSLLTGALGILFSPVVLIGAAVGTLVTAFIIMYQRLQPVREAVETAGKVLSGLRTVLRLLFDTLTGGDPTIKSTETAFTGLARTLSRIAAVIRPILAFVGRTLGESFSALGGIIRQTAESFRPLIEALQRVLANKTVQDVLKAIGIAMLALAVAPVIAFFASLIAVLKVLQVVLSFINDHFETVKKVVIAIVAIALLPAVVAIGLIIGAFKLLMVIIAGVVDAWQWLNRTIDTIIGAFQAAWSFIVTAASAIRDAVVNAFRTVVDAITGIFSGIFNTIVTTFNAIAGFLAPIAEFIKNILIIVFGSILIVILDVLIAIKAAIIEAWNFVYGVTSSVFTAVYGFLVGIWQAVYGFIVGILSAIRDFIVVTWQAIYGFIIPIVQAIYNFLVASWQAVYAAAVSAFNSLRDFIASVWNTIYGIIRGIVSSIIGFFAGAFSWLYGHGRDIVLGLAAGISSVASSVWGAIKAVADQIGRFFTGAGSWLFGVGQAIVQGLVNGLRSMAGAVADAASSIANGVKSRVTNLLGIHSPSTVFRDIGVNTVQGYIKGLQAMGGSLGRTIATVFDNMNEVGNLGSTIAAMPVGGRVSNSNAEAGGITTIINGNITIGSEVDADRFLQRLTRNQELASKGATTI